jgi:two-component system, response regulator PdtaR
METSEIFLIEDEFIVAADIKQNLEDLGYKVTGIAANGEEALRKIGKIKPDLILIDIMLNGDLDGIETAKQINILYDIPFIYLTGYFDNNILDRAKLTQPSGYMIKPFDKITLHSTIQMALHKHYNQEKLKRTAEILEFANESLKEINK